MLAIRKGSATKGVAMYEIEEPEVPEGWALVKVLKASICGTDVHIYQWNEWSQKRMKPPVTIGHEFVGKVLKVNKGQEEYKRATSFLLSHMWCATFVACAGETCITLAKIQES